MMESHAKDGSSWGGKSRTPAAPDSRCEATTRRERLIGYDITRIFFPTVPRIVLFIVLTLLVMLAAPLAILYAETSDGFRTSEVAAVVDYVEVFDGDMPLMFAVGHGGWEQVGELENGTYAADPLLQDYFYRVLAVRIYEKTGHLPYIVYQQGNRNYVNTNGPVDTMRSYHPDNAKARAAYFEFHDQVDAMIARLEAKYGEDMGLMINPHTTDLSASIGSRPWDRIADIGFIASVTNLGAVSNTMKALYDRKGETTFRGQDSIPYQLFHGQDWPSASAVWPAAATSNSKTLARSGDDVWHVLPAWVTGWGTDGWVTGYYNGAYNILYHGTNTSGHHSNWSNGLDAFQIEFNYTKASGIALNQSGPYQLDVPFTTALMDDFIDAILHSLEVNYDWTPGGVYNVIVDNGESGFSTIGAWQASQGNGFWGTESIYSDQNGATATWQPNLTQAGTYEVFVRWTDSGDRTYDAQYTVHDVNGSQTITIDQDAGGDAKWVSLGEFRFTIGTSGSVVLRCTGTGESTSADAVLFRLISRNQVPTAAFTATPALGRAPLQVSFDAGASTDDDGSIQEYYWQFGDGETGRGQTINHTLNSPGDYLVKLRVTDDGGAQDTFTVVVGVSSATADNVVTVDNTDAGFATTGSWIESEADVEYGGSSIYAMADGATATWTPYLPQAGRYIVLTWCTYWSTRAQNAPYTITHARGSHTVRVNQRDNAGRWIGLGVYEFRAGTSTVQNVKVTREAGDGTSTCADAIRFVLVEDQDYLPLVVREPEPMKGFKMQAPSCSDAAEGTGRVDVLHRAGANTVFYTIYWGEFYYPTIHAPHRGFDSLAHIIAESESRGMDVYALLPAAEMGWREHPEWNARTNYSGVTEDWLDFTIPAARQWLADVCVEIVTKYNVRGIALDLLRWHHWYKAAGLTAEPIDQTMQLIYDSVKAARPDALVTTTPIADYDYAVEWRAQDWLMWLDQGWSDQVYVMAYMQVGDDMAERQGGRIERIQASSHWPERIIPLLSLTRFEPETDRPIVDILADIQMWRDAGAAGMHLFDDRSVAKRSTLIEALAVKGW